MGLLSLLRTLSSFSAINALGGFHVFHQTPAWPERGQTKGWHRLRAFVVSRRAHSGAYRYCATARLRLMRLIALKPQFVRHIHSRRRALCPK